MPTPLRVLILEDRQTDAELVVRELRRAEFEPTWVRVDSEADFLARLRDGWEIILSDFYMPTFDATRALQLLRESGLNVPFIIVSGTIGEDTAVKAMKMGATDYLLKDRLARLGQSVALALDAKKLRAQARLAQEALLRSEELFRQLSESSPLGILLMDSFGHCTYCNPRCRAIFNLSLMQMMNLGWTQTIHADDRETVITGMREAAQQQREWVGEFRIQLAGVAIRWVRLRSSSRLPEEAKVAGHVVSIEDITDSKLLEEQFIEAQKMEAVGHLAGGIAHDFNNMLAVIMGYGHLLEAKAPPEDPVHKYAEQIRLAADRAVGLTRQLLAFSRKQAMQFVVLDLNEVVGGMEKLLRRLIDEHVELTVVPGKDLGRVKADSGYIGQVLMNLVVNARDAMPGGGKITIGTSNAVLDEHYAGAHKGVVPGDYVMLSVSDTGTGISEEVKAHLFEPFFTTKPKGKGTGLGLATCQTIVKQSGGHIGVYSELGRGTTFKVYFPRVDQPLDALAQPAGPAALPRGTETILIVEDEPAVRHLAASILQAQGYAVLQASHGEDGLRVVREHKGAPIQLVLTDVIMPQMGGRPMAESLQLTRPDLKIVFTSGYTDDALAQHGVLDPSIAFLPKPYTPETLSRKVRETLDRMQQAG